MMHLRIHARATCDNDKPCGYLGFSMGNSFYSLKRMQAYSAWAEINFHDFAVLIGDWIYAFTHSHFHGVTHASSLRVATAMGDAATAMCEKVSKSRTRPLTVMRWRDLMAMREYRPMFQALVSEFNTNPVFRNEVCEQVFVNLGAKVGKPVKEAITRHIPLHPLAKYLLHEIAGLISVSEFTRYHTEVYPGKDLFIIDHIYAGRYPRILKLLPAPRVRQFVSIIME